LLHRLIYMLRKIY